MNKSEAKHRCTFYWNYSHRRQSIPAPVNNCEGQLIEIKDEGWRKVYWCPVCQRVETIHYQGQIQNYTRLFEFMEV